MARGQKSEEGTTRIAPNGYHYSKVDGKWRLTHHVLAEKKLGRPLMPWERALFKDKNRKNLTIENIIVVDKGNITPEQKIARIEREINNLIHLREEIAHEAGLSIDL